MNVGGSIYILKGNFSLKLEKVLDPPFKGFVQCIDVVIFFQDQKDQMRTWRFNRYIYCYSCKEIRQVHLKNLIITNHFLRNRKADQQKTNSCCFNYYLCWQWPKLGYHITMEFFWNQSLVLSTVMLNFWSIPECYSISLDSTFTMILFL